MGHPSFVLVEERGRHSLVADGLCWAVKKSAPTLCERGNLGAGEIDFAIPRHQQLDGLQAWIAGGTGAALVDEFIRQVLDRVAENLQRVSSLQVDMTFALYASFRCRKIRRKN